MSYVPLLLKSGCTNQRFRMTFLGGGRACMYVDIRLQLCFVTNPVPQWFQILSIGNKCVILILIITCTFSLRSFYRGSLECCPSRPAWCRGARRREDVKGTLWRTCRTSYVPCIESRTLWRLWRVVLGRSHVLFAVTVLTYRPLTSGG